MAILTGMEILSMGYRLHELYREAAEYGLRVCPAVLLKETLGSGRQHSFPPHSNPVIPFSCPYVLNTNANVFL